MQTPTAADLTAVSPTLFLVVWAMALLLVSQLLPRGRRDAASAWLAVLGLVVAFVLSVLRWHEPATGFKGALVLDDFSLLFHAVFVLAGLLTVLVSHVYLRDRAIERSEYYPLLLLSICGMTLMSSVNDFVILFIALELLSIPLYVLAGFAHPAAESEESALKYFLLGAFSSAFLIYGVALVYGGTGTSAFPGIVEGATSGNMAFAVTGAGLILVGLGFKIAAVPFHMWTPDVYHGAPTPITGFMSVGAKAAGFAAIGRVFLLTLAPLTVDWTQAAAVLAALTMILGNVVAISQTNIKRMLAYSSIAHAGYLLMGVAAGGERGISAMLFYLLAYAFTNLGAFAILTGMAGRDGEDTSFVPYAGLAKRQPWAAAAMALFMLSLTGIPATGGFVGKYYLFWATVEADLIWLAVLGVLTSLVSAFFYLRVVVTMYFEELVGDVHFGLHPTLAVALILAAVGTIALGLWPGPLLNLTQDAAWSTVGPMISY